MLCFVLPRISTESYFLCLVSHVIWDFLVGARNLKFWSVFMILPLQVHQFYIFSVAVSRCEDLRFIINVFRLRVLNVPLSHLRAQELELCAIESRIGTVLTSPLTMFI